MSNKELHRGRQVPLRQNHCFCGLLLQSPLLKIEGPTEKIALLVEGTTWTNTRYPRAPNKQKSVLFGNLRPRRRYHLCTWKPRAIVTVTTKDYCRHIGTLVRPCEWALNVAGFIQAGDIRPKTICCLLQSPGHHRMGLFHEIRCIGL